MGREGRGNGQRVGRGSGTEGRDTGHTVEVEGKRAEVMGRG